MLVQAAAGNTAILTTLALDECHAGGVKRMAAETVRALLEVGRDADASSEFAVAVMDALSERVPFDGYCLFGMDPLSGVRTFMYSRNGLDGVADQLTHNEFVEKDANRYRDLATAARPIGSMSTADPLGRRSPRMHDMLRPSGFGSELRLMLRSSGRVFGGISLFREAVSRPFDDLDMDRVVGLAPHLCSAVQRHPVRATPVPRTVLPIGVILIDSSNRVVTQTVEADRWLAEMCSGGADQMLPADQMRMVFDVTNASRTAAGPAASRIRTPTGRWLLVEATPVDAAPADTAVTLGAADLASLLPAASAWLGLTHRESEVLAALSQGIPARRIAQGLALAVPTVNAYLQSIYRKADVTGRDQLLASLG